MSHWQKPPLGALPEPGYDICRGLVGLWLFNEGSGGQVFDLSGNGYHGTFVNDVSWTAGKHGPCLEFDSGHDDYINCGRITAAYGKPGLTVIAWVKMREADDGTVANFLNNYGSGDDCFNLYRGTDGNLYFFVKNAAQDQSNGNFVDGLLDTDWHMVGGVYNGVDCRAYVDTVVGANIGALTGLTATPGNDLYIGNDVNSHDGLIGCGMIYNRALAAYEIAQLYAEQFCMFEDE